MVNFRDSYHIVPGGIILRNNMWDKYVRDRVPKLVSKEAHLIMIVLDVNPESISLMITLMEQNAYNVLERVIKVIIERDATLYLAMCEEARLIMR